MGGLLIGLQCHFTEAVTGTSLMMNDGERLPGCLLLSTGNGGISYSNILAIFSVECSAETPILFNRQFFKEEMMESLYILLNHLEFRSRRPKSKMLPCHPHSQHPTCAPPNIYNMPRQVERNILSPPYSECKNHRKSCLPTSRVRNRPIFPFLQVFDETPIFLQCEQEHQ